MFYKYDIHVHTKEGSPCGKNTAEEIVRAYANAGYTGLVITDHFTENTTKIHGGYKNGVDNQYHAYLLAKEEGDKQAIDVFFAIEFRYQSYDFLTYGITPEFLYANEDIFNIPFSEYSRRVHEVGGIIFQAHPFRYDKTNPLCIQLPFVDGIEIYNGSHLDNITTPYPSYFNELAEILAEKMGLIGIAGSDTHDVDFSDNTPFRKASMLFPEKLVSIVHMKELILERKFSIYKC